MARSSSLNLGDEGQGITQTAAKVSEEVKNSARKTVCHYAENSRDATELMRMLGIAPGQELD